MFIPVYIIWNKGNYFEEASLNQYSIGNLGSSSTVWSSSFLDEDNFIETCAIGKISSLISVGVLPKGFGINDACLRSPDTSKWDHSIDKHLFLSDFHQNCYGKSSCQMKGFKSKYVNSASSLWSDNIAVGFYKFTCSQNHESYSVSIGIRWLLTAINILWGVIFLFALRNFRFRTGKEFSEYDQDTVITHTNYPLSPGWCNF